MRSLFALLMFTVTSLVSVQAAEVEFVRVWPGWRDAASFERISEYFTGEENAGREIVLRTRPEQREGFYFLVRVANAGEVLAGTKFVLQVIDPSSPDAKTTIFPTNVPGRSKVFLLGLTGRDWAGADVHPVAWKLELRAADDRVLASAQSFLWEKPAAQ
ncbi:MAG TPA: hypothetical protein VL069_11845 [Opitutus sp.]|nr:hypothetical protein [Opitutus sp.]